jgi:membrane AbrB-like protein
MSRAETIGAAGVLSSALAGASLFVWLGFPIPFLTGSLAGAALFSLVRKGWIPPYSREFAQVVLGIAIGQTVNATIAAQIARLLPSMVGAGLLAIAIGYTVAALIVRIGKIDRTTAFFATIPGGVAEMAVITDRLGGRAPVVAVSQSLRVAGTVFVVPSMMVLLNIRGAFVATEASFGTAWQWMSVSVLVGTILAFAFRAFRIPNPWLFAGLSVGVALGMTLPDIRVIPVVFVQGAQIMLGLGLGMRFSRQTMRELAGFLPLSALATTLLIVMSVLAAFVLNMVSGVELGTLILGLAPGGSAEMSITAKVQHFDVGVVAAFHITRIILVLVLCQPLHALFARK